MELVFLGSGRFGIDSLQAIQDSEHDLKLIVTQPARRAGRGRKLKPTAAAQWAQQNGIECIEAPNINDPEIVEKIAAAQADLAIVIAFGQKLGREIIGRSARLGLINLHGSVLPKYRGAAPVNYAILQGEQRAGVTVVTVTEEFDAGKILGTVDTQIGETETAEELAVRLAKIGAPLLIEELNKIEEGTAEYKDQDPKLVTFAPKLKKEQGALDFSQPAAEVCRTIHGLWPWPGGRAVYCPQNGKQVTVKIKRAKVVGCENTDGLETGTFDENLHVVCGECAIEILEIKPENSGLMSFEAFANGRRVQRGDCLKRVQM